MATFLCIWFLWLRRLIQQIRYLQISLENTQDVLAQRGSHPVPPVPELNLEEFTEAAEAPSFHQASPSSYIEIDPSISPQQRERIIRYLREEGFLPEQ